MGDEVKFRALGRTNLQVSEVGFGAWAIGGGMWGKTDDAESLKALRRALDLGVNFVDTAAVYGNGHSEQLVGKVWRERNGAFYVATKIPPKDGNWPAQNNSPIRSAFPAAWVREQTEKNLRNLNLERIDVQQIHVWSSNWVRETEWIETLIQLRQEGKIRFIGVSIGDPKEALGLAKSGLADTIQVVYNIFDQSPEDELFPLCRNNNVGVIARSPLDEGSLTGKFSKDTKFSQDDWRNGYFSPAVLRETVERVERLKPRILKEAPSMTVGALKFCLSHPAVSTVIPGIRSIAQAEENCRASNGAFPPGFLAEIKKHRWVRD